jgi:hypothetical protein
MAMLSIGLVYFPVIWKKTRLLLEDRLQPVLQLNNQLKSLETAKTRDLVQIL